VLRDLQLLVQLIMNKVEDIVLKFSDESSPAFLLSIVPKLKHCAISCFDNGTEGNESLESEASPAEEDNDEFPVESALSVPKWLSINDWSSILRNSLLKVSRGAFVSFSRLLRRWVDWDCRLCVGTTLIFFIVLFL